MDRTFHAGNRARFYEQMADHSVLVLFSGEELRKTADEFYPFFAERHFVYMTGIRQKESVLVAVKDASGSVTERLYMLPSDPMAERWTGTRLTAQQAEAVSGVSDIRPVALFRTELHRLLALMDGGMVYLDTYRTLPTDQDRASHRLLKELQAQYPWLSVGNADAILRRLRLIKQPCELEAMRRAERITGEGIRAMMHISRPGLYEYQYKAEFDRVLGQYSPDGPGFPSIISAGQNNFCIHYYSYTGQAQDGDMVLNDVGAQWDGMITDVSRGFPCNGHFTERQALLFNCMRQTSDHMFSLVKPGMRMADVDATNRSFCAALLKDAGVLSDVSEVGRVMWHGGAHHVGWDVHDMIAMPEVIAPGMVFCVDIGIYNEDWGIGFRLEDSCLVTEDGCENLSVHIPRSVADIEDEMRR